MGYEAPRGMLAEALREAAEPVSAAASRERPRLTAYGSA
jgi:hypothetical protein